jgi:hypothetical protein
MSASNFNAFASHKNSRTFNRLLKTLPQAVQNNYKNKISRKQFTAAYNAISGYLPANTEKIPQNVKNNYKNKISRGNFIAAYNAVARYLPGYRRNNLANLVGGRGSHPVTSRLPYMMPISVPPAMLPYNIKRNNNAKLSINRAVAGNARRMVEMLQPYRKPSGGVGLGYAFNQIKKNTNPVKYALVNKASGDLYAFALLKNNKNHKNSRYLNIVGGYPKYGSALLRKIINNAKKPNNVTGVPKLNTLNLRAVVTRSSEYKNARGKVLGIIPINNTGKRNELVGLYEHLGFNTNGRYVNHTGLQPMTLYIKPKQEVMDKRKAARTRKRNQAAALVTPRETRARVSAATPLAFAPGNATPAPRSRRAPAARARRR